MPINVDLLNKICTTSGAPGFEQEIRTLVLNEIRDLADEVEVDNMGNVYAIKRGTGDKRVMVGAHMDEIGFIVTHIDDNGFIRFHTLGGFDPKTLTAQRVIVHGEKDIIGVMASKPIHVMTPEERNKIAKTKDYFIDTGMSAEEVKEIVEKLRSIIALKSENLQLEITIPAQYASQSYSVLKSVGSLKKEEWQNNGSLKAILEIPAAARPNVIDRLGSITKGSATVEIMK